MLLDITTTYWALHCPKDMENALMVHLQYKQLDEVCCKGKGLDTSYSTIYMSQTHDQQCFTISKVAADWHEPMVPQHIMWSSIACANGQLDPRCS